MQSFLNDADSRQGESGRLRNWVSEIRELAYDAEDVVEAFALKIGSKRKGGFSNTIKRSACIWKEGWELRKTRSQIEKIRTRITELIRQLQTYGVRELREGEESSSSSTRRELRRSYPHIIEDNIVGLKSEIQELVSVLLNHQSPNHRVLSICGMGGLGKTTLAKKVYHHTQVRAHFDRMAWVYVSQQCQRRKVWEDILAGLLSSNERDFKLSDLSDQELAAKLFNLLKEKKCLVILDDIWSIEAWDSLKAGFSMAGDTRSKILLTSRNKEVASHADRRGYLFELQCLEEEDSWELFQKVAFPDKDSPDQRVDAKMKKLGKDMVKSCAGLPLAVIVLGGILVTKCSLNEWEMVFENVKSYLKKGKGQGIEDVLALSFDDLPSHLRPCFLYLCHFPEDYEINAHRLIQLWVAEGIVSSKQEEGDGGEIAEDVAERYFIELVERCMIQVRKRDIATLKIKTFQMHDLMRDLCLSKSKQENFLFIVDQSNAFSLPVIQRVRRVSAHKFFWIQRTKSPTLRSILFFNEFFPLEAERKVYPSTMMNYFEKHEDEHLNPLRWIVVFLLLCMLFSKIQGIWTYMFNNFKLLRVLYFQRGSNEAGCRLSSDIGNLIHLRFLSLMGFTFLRSKLPTSLGNLTCLQTLDLRLGWEVHVPDVIWRMKRLRHLYLPENCNRKTKLKLGTLRNLQTLVNFNTRSCYVEDLINMTNLRKLKIRGPFNIEDFNMEDLDKIPPIIEGKYLHYLSIVNYERIDPRHLTHLLSSCVHICKLDLDVEISKLPEYRYLSSNIAYIQLKRCKLQEDPMPTLEKLPNLRILELCGEALIGKEMFFSASGFPKLDSLILFGLDNLEEWKVDEGAMPALRDLEIKRCQNLKMLPDGLRFISTLEKLTIEEMPQAFKDKVMVGGEDFHKVQRVPSIVCRKCDN